MERERESYNLISTIAVTVDDWQKMRIATDNRIRDYEMDIPVGVLRSEQETPTSTYALLIRQADQIREHEREAVRQLEWAMSQTAVGRFAKSAPGLGAASVGRLLGCIGDPGWNATEDRPRRGPAELWAYCGMHVVDGKAPRRKAGVQSNWNDEARARMYVIVESIVRSRGQYRKKYDKAREKYADAVHTQPCIRCGPSGHPAKIGSPLSDGHKHARAMRLVGKSVLVDLFRVSNGQKPLYGKRRTSWLDEHRNGEAERVEVALKKKHKKKHKKGKKEKSQK